MLNIEIPGWDEINIKYLILDYNGTIAIDGKLISGVKELLNQLSGIIEVHVITADTFGFAKKELRGVNCKFKIISNEFQDKSKLDYVCSLGLENIISIGNGRNDNEMLKYSKIGISLIQEEGVFLKTLISSDIVLTNIIDALQLLLNPLRLKATLRN